MPRRHPVNQLFRILRYRSHQAAKSSIGAAEKIRTEADFLLQTAEDTLLHREPATLTEQLKAKNSVHCVQPAGDYVRSRERQYKLYVPSSYTGKKPVPLVMILHGCLQNHEDIEEVSNFSALAERDGFIVVYPHITSYTGMRVKNCWGWWLPGQIKSGAGEVEDLWQIVQSVKADYNIDSRRVHGAGLSSGAGMAVALMVAHNQGIAAGAAVAGVAYGESSQAVLSIGHLSPHYRSNRTLVRKMEAQLTEGKHKLPLFVVHSYNDTTVDIQAAKNLRDTWAQCFDISLKRKGSQHTGETGDCRWQHTAYRRGLGRSELETLWLEGPDHGWYGGNPGRFSFPDSINISEKIWRFFKTHPFESP